MRAAKLLLPIALSVWTASIMPACASGWTSADYVALYFQHYNGQVPLPHLRNSKQRVLFNHLVDPQNLARILAAPGSEEDKLRELRLILSTLGGFRAAYNFAVVVGEPLQQELTLVQAFMLSVASALAGLEQHSSERVEVATMRMTLLTDVIASIGDSSRYTALQRTTLADAVTRNYPAIAAVLDSSQRRRLSAQAGALQSDPDDPALLHALTRMQQTMQQMTR